MKEIIVDVNVLDGHEGLTIEERQRAYDLRLKEGPLFIQAKKPEGNTAKETFEKLCTVELPHVWQVKSVDFTKRKAVVIPSPEVADWIVSGLTACGITIVENGIIKQILSMYFVDKLSQVNLESLIVSAAARSPSGIIIASVRHGDELFYNAVDNMKLLPEDENLHYWDQGFVNTKREFLTREEAWVVAEHNNQIRNELPCDSSKRLYSENLY